MGGEFDAGYTEYQTQRSWLRKAVRRFYLHSARSLLRGPTLDFGCGVGELLAGLPAGSIGIEYNEVSVEHCRRQGLDVRWYDGYADGWRLSLLPQGSGLRSMVISHVLEHFDEPTNVLPKLLVAAQRLGIERVLVIVPGRAGYKVDATHKTFVDETMLRQEGLTEETDFQLATTRYFPGNLRVFGDWFPHHELQALFRR